MCWDGFTREEKTPSHEDFAPGDGFTVQLQHAYEYTSTGNRVQYRYSTGTVLFYGDTTPAFPCLSLAYSVFTPVHHTPYGYIFSA